MEYILHQFGNGMHYLLPDEMAVGPLLKDGNRRVICRLNGQVEFHCAVMNQKGMGYFVYVGAAVRKKLGIVEGSKVVAEFLPDRSEYRFEMPEELGEVLDTDPEAFGVFQKLTAGNQRGLMHLVAQAKTVDKRIERALKIANRLKNGITSPRVILK